MNTPEVFLIATLTSSEQFRSVHCANAAPYSLPRSLASWWWPVISVSRAGRIPATDWVQFLPGRLYSPLCMYALAPVTAR